MNKKWLYLIPIFLIGFNARAWKLLVIQSVEESGRSFTTRTAPERTNCWDKREPLL